LTANSVEIGEGKVSMPVNYGGSPLHIAFNPTFFLDILRHSSDETVNLGLTDAFNPGIITDSSGALCVIMPMRLQDE
jgi:DNA polymerase-3 subunit beta